MTERLDCGSCKLSPSYGEMCDVVARRTVAEVAKIGYDTSSDMKAYSQIVSNLMLRDSRVVQLAGQECALRLVRQEGQ